MHFITKLTKRTAMVALVSGASFAVSGVTYAATLNQNLFYIDDLPVVVELDGSLPVQTAMRPQLEAQAKPKPAQPTPAMAPTPSGAEIVNKLLSPGPSDPNVPLPRSDLAGENTAQTGSSDKTQIFGRREDGGGILGLRVPIPADRNAAGSNTRYSPR